MSTSPGRRRRLALARSLPAATCPACGVQLERVAVVNVHLRRCDGRLAQEEAALQAVLEAASL